MLTAPWCERRGGSATVRLNVTGWSSTGEGRRPSTSSRFPRASPTTTAPLIAWSRTFPAVPQQAREARQFLAEILDDRPADDAILCLSELVTNACLHSASAERGGRLAVRVQLHGAHLRVEVRDEGGPWAASQREDIQGGRGLLIVDRLASTWGRSGNAETGWITWFELDPCS